MSPRHARKDFYAPEADLSYLQQCLDKLVKSFQGAPLLAAVMGVNPATLYRWLHGKSTPQTHWLKLIYRLYEQHVVEAPAPKKMYRTRRTRTADKAPEVQ